MTDIEISRAVEKLNIKEIAKKLKLDEKDLILYGNDKAKITLEKGTKKGKIILVTATNPTPFGEGKTTVSIGLGDALNKLGKDISIVLRQPSMGPVFGIKGGATGGGYSQVTPMEDINLHFTGDFHAITMANNLLSAAIDNHIERGNELKIKEVLFNRCLDVNDRELREVQLNNRKESFNITAASEMMALFCLANDLDDLKKRLGNIIIGKDESNRYVLAKELNIEGALTTILKDAFYPNLVQTLEHTPVLIHGGPFANIAHGCNSIKATKLAVSLTDYIVTEAGFGSDLGAEKFFDIKCRVGNIKPDCIVLVTTIRSLRFNGEDNLEKGLSNLEAHIDNLKQNNSNIVVCLNKFATDTESDIEVVRRFVKSKNTPFSLNTSYIDGGQGSISLAKEVLCLLQNENEFEYLYDVNRNIKEKISDLAKKVYHADKVEYSQRSLDLIEEIEEKRLKNLPICTAKTQYSLSDDKTKLGYPKHTTIFVKDIKVYQGAGFITVLLGNILTMPGLPEKPNYEKINLDKNNHITGLF